MKEYRKLLNKADPLGEVKEVKVSYSEQRPHPKRNEKEDTEGYLDAVRELERLLQPVVRYLENVVLRERDIERVLRQLPPVKRMQRELDILLGLHSKEKRLRKCWMYTAWVQAAVLAMMLVIAIIR